MPFIKPNEGMMEEAGESPFDDWEYCPPWGDGSDVEPIDPHADLLLKALVAAGATRFRVKYDGGNDEGFAHPDVIFFGTTEKPVAAVAAEIDAGELSSRLSEKRIDTDEAFRMLADLFASQLLGGGYGTGEYEMYGAFIADLRTGEIVDDPEADNKPAE